MLSQADRLLIQYAVDELPQELPVTVLHDRFGAVGLSLPQPVRFVTSFHSQEEAIRRNATGAPPPMVTLPAGPAPVAHALVRIPKAVELFEYYLAYLAAHARPGMRVAAGFMTRYFTARLLQLGQQYATTVTQTRAHKKARLLLLSDFKPLRQGAGPRVLRRSQVYRDVTYTQYFGVFSARHVDHATQFLLDIWPDDLPTPATILDIGCGNGIIGDQLLRRYPKAQLTATDDFSLAVASARQNLPSDRATVHYAHTLAGVADRSQELVVTNPPFHVGHTNTLAISLALFGEVRRVLTATGSFILVANRHLNYATHLGQLFAEVVTVGENNKYLVYCCRY